MKVQEKKSKRKEDVKVLILNAAKKLFLEEGYQSASIRKIAAEIGLSPTTIYLYYKDKSDIAYALHLEGFAILRTLFSALISVESPFERLKATGRIYLKFSVDNPDFYSIMFMMKEPMDFLDSELSEVEGGCWEEGKQIFEFLTYTIQECQQEGYFPDQDPNHIALQAWALVHGLSSLMLTTHLRHVSEVHLMQGEVEELLEMSYKTYVHFMEQTKIKK